MLNKQKNLGIGIGVTVLLGLALVLMRSSYLMGSTTRSIVSQPSTTITQATNVSAAPAPANDANAVATGTTSNVSAKFVWPISQPTKRMTIKPFGLHVDPKHSPVPLERFTGYHTGVDFETFPEEKDSDVAVNAVCEGRIASVRSASGYGGVVVQACKWNKKDITVIYGHLKLASVTVKEGDRLKAGQQFALLGKGYSNETDGERKHLHLGIHVGTRVNILGYVAKTTDLKQWVDFRTLKPSVR